MCESRSPLTAYRRSAAVVIGLAMTLLASSLPAFAQHRAALAKDLADDIKYRGTSTVNVLYDGPQSEVDRLAKTYHVKVVKRLDSGAVFSGSASQFGTMSGDVQVTSLHEDNVVKGAAAVAEVTTQATGASQLWVGKNGKPFSGITGSDITVAVIDSGVSPIQGDLKNRILFWKDFYDPTETSMTDEYGHGTHVAGMIAGSGAGSEGGPVPAYVGMAPGANIISLRVLGADGSGNASTVIDGINWTITNKAKFQLRVINLSLAQ